MMSLVAQDTQPLPTVVNRALLDRLPDGIAVLAGGRIVFSNAAFARFAKRPATRLLGGGLAELFDEALDSDVAALLDVMPEDEPGLTLTLGERTLTLTVKPLDSDHALALLRDISAQADTDRALRETEWRYRGIFENAVEGIYQSHAPGRLPRRQSCAGSHLRV